MSMAGRLRELAHPMAEAMSDRARLDAFVSAAIEAADEIDGLQKALVLLRAERDHWRGAFQPNVLPSAKENAQ